MTEPRDEVSDYIRRLETALDEFENGGCLGDYTQPRLRHGVSTVVKLLKQEMDKARAARAVQRTADK